MTNNTIQVSGGDDGLIAMWEPHSCLISNMESALDAIGKKTLLPKGSVAKSALRFAFKRFLDKSPLHVRGNVPEIFPLAPEVNGFEARRLNRGKDSNDPEFIMSVVVDSNGEVTIPKFDAGLIPSLTTKQTKAEEAMSSLYAQRSTYYPTEMASGTIARVIESLGGLLVRKTGGVYFVPPHNVSVFETFCNALDGAGPELVTYNFAIKPGERSFKAVLAAVKRIAQEQLKEVEEGLNKLGDKKQRSDGQQSRIEVCLTVKAMLTEYENILGVSLKEFQDMADDVKAAVSAHTALDFAA
jgi:hypothetical protein